MFSRSQIFHLKSRVYVTQSSPTKEAKRCFISIQECIILGL